jgi:hypothetical protein
MDKVKEWVFKHRFFAMAFIRSQGARVLLFLAVNVIFGALGFLMPVSVEYFATDELYPALKKQLNAAGPYTFSIAFLAASVSLVVDEYLALDKKADHRTFKVVTSIFAALLIVFCAVFSGSQTAREMLSSASTPTAQEASQKQVVKSPGTDQVKLDAQEVAKNPPNGFAALWSKFDRQDRLQIWTTMLAVVVGLFLFLVFKLEEPSMQAELERYQSKIKVEAHELAAGLTIPGQ